MRLTIDDKPVQVRSGYTLLQAAREHDIRIPTLCSHEALKPYGACRMCLVELASERGSRLVASCAYPCEENLDVRTNSDLVIRARRTVIELLTLLGAKVGRTPCCCDDTTWFSSVDTSVTSAFDR